jgi:hypothetical protein
VLRLLNILIILVLISIRKLCWRDTWHRSSSQFTPIFIELYGRRATLSLNITTRTDTCKRQWWRSEVAMDVWSFSIIQYLVQHTSDISDKKAYLMSVAPYILVTYIFSSSPTRCTVHYILYFLDNVIFTYFGCYLHPSSGAQLQRTAESFVWFGVLFH